MLKEAIPTDIQSLIVSVWNQSLKDPEIDRILPPEPVRAVLLAEMGITAPQPEERPREALRWVQRQRDFQDEAARVIAQLQDSEPFTAENAKSASLPRWSVQRWAESLYFDWGSELGDAVTEAKLYLSTQ